tara:strand:- start:965 stop:1861 length:897 start_codon:yes stop_codon:yes gene_type:complete
MRWLQISIKSPPEYVEPLTHLFNLHGEGSASVEHPGGYNPDEGETPNPTDWITIKGWLPFDETTESRKTAIDVGIRLIRHFVELPKIKQQEVNDEQWRNQKFAPIRIGKNLVILPRSADFKKKKSDVLITLEPGLAFGTGHHPTTRMCLEEIEKIIKPNDRILDVGCGSGILSIAALALGAQHATGMDIENDAVNASIRNVKDAGFLSQSTILSGSFPHDELTSGDFDIVVANIAANVLIKLADAIVATVAEDGIIIISGVLKTRINDVISAFEFAGGKVQSRRQLEDWTTTLIKRSR